MTPVHHDDWLTIYGGDCRAVLAQLPAESVQTVVTSPPYWGLRDYGLEPVEWPDGWLGSLGLEPRPEEYVEHIVDVFREVRRVLRRDGTLWLNLGDSYADRANRRSDGESFREDRADVVPPKRNSIGGAYRLKPKDRIMVPARVALALQADGWWLRDEIVWSKPNPMPSSVRDRTTPAHEMVYLLSRSARYHYDADAIREQGTTTRPELLVFGPRVDVGFPGGSPPWRRLKSPDGWDTSKGEGGHGRVHRSGREKGRYKTVEDPHARGAWQAPEPGEPNAFHPLGRNKRSVWTVATQPYPDAHFATFPERLIEPMILAGAPAGATVLDPFGGSGTVALVAERLGRRSIIVDLNAGYVDQALERIAYGRAAGQGAAVDIPLDHPDDSLWAAPGLGL